MLGVLDPHQRRTEHAAKQPLHRQHHRDHRSQVADDAGGLRADQVRHLVDKAFDRGVVRHIGQLVCQRGRGHGRLLGGHGPVQGVHQHEAAGVVHAGPEAAPKRRQPERGQRELDQRGAGNHRPAAGCGAQHVGIFGAVAGDVVLAGFSAALGHLARQQRVVAREQRLHAAPLVGGSHQVGQQQGHVARCVGAEHTGQQLLDAVGALAQLVDLEHHVDRHAVLFKVLVHAVGAAAAGVEQGAQVLRVAQQRGVVGARRVSARLVAHRFGHARELRKRRVGQQLGAHALAQRTGKPGRPHRAAQKHDGIEQRGLPVGAMRVGRRRQQHQPLQGGLVQRFQPQRIARLWKQQPEQLAQVGGGRCLRQQFEVQALQQFAGEIGARRKAEIGEQRGDVHVMPEAAQQGGHRGAVRRVALEHVEQVLEPQHRRGGLRLARHRRVAQPFQRADQPQMALGQRGGGVGCERGRIQQGRQVPG